MATGIERPDLERVGQLLRDPTKDMKVHSGARSKPMKVLCLGMGRTGTTSLAAALKTLGYTPYDFIDRFYRQHLGMWDDAMRAKFMNHGRPWSRAEFDNVTGDFDSLLDIPCCLFVEELVAEYPDAKVILNVRDDPDKWLASMNKTLYKVFRWQSWKVLQYSEPTLCGPWFRHVNLIMDVFCDSDRGELCKQRYLEHNDRVRKTVPSDRLLEYQITDGWQPLCHFLDLPIPDAAFPAGNHPEEFVETHTKLWWVAIYMSVRRIARYSIVPAIVVATTLAWRTWS